MKNIMYKLLMFICLSVYCSCINAQVFQSNKLRADLDSLVKYMDIIHPEPYTYISKNEFIERINVLKNSIIQPMSDYDFYLQLAPIIATLKDEHTELGFNENLKQRRGSCLLFPFTGKVVNDRFFIDSSFCIYNEFDSGEILSINGLNISDILSKLRMYLGVVSEQDKDPIISKVFFMLYPSIFNFPNSYQISILKDGKDNSIIINKSQVTGDIRFSFSEPAESKLNLVLISKGTAVLKIPSFEIQRYMQFDKIFTRLKNNKIENLIIDVRGNRGGFIWNVDTLMTYLTDKPYKQYDSIFSKISFKSIHYVREALNSGIGKQVDNFYYLTPDKVIPSMKLNRFNGKIYVLTSSYSYSASAAFANIIQCNSLGFVIGEETGQKTIMYANANPAVELPNTKLLCYISSDKAVFSCSKIGRGVVPDFLIENTNDNLNIEKDSILKFTLKLIEKK